MIRRDPISKDDVEQALADLVAAGAAPTCRAVRDALGGGSMTTISRLMREIERERSAPVTAAVTRTPVQAARVGQVIEAFLGELRAEDRIEIERIKAEAEARIATAERRADELAEAVDAEQLACEERLKQTADEIDELRRRMATLAGERDAAQSAAVEARALRSQSELALAQLQGDHGRLQARLEALVAEGAALRQRLEGATALLAERQQEIEQLGARADGLAQGLAAERLMRAQAEDKAARLTETEAALLARTEELGRLRAELDRPLKRRAPKRAKADPTAISS